MHLLALFGHHQEINDVPADELIRHRKVEFHLALIADYLSGFLEQAQLVAIVRLDFARVLMTGET
jgi:hypothetical protein